MRDFERKVRAIRGRIERARKRIDMRRFRDFDKVITERIEKEISALINEAESLQKNI